MGETIMPKVTFTPSNASNKGEIWTSSDEKIATVSSRGTIRARAKGRCRIFVYAANGVSKAVAVTVR